MTSWCVLILLISCVQPFGGTQRLKQSIRIEPQSSWPAAKQEFDSRLTRWPSSVTRFIQHLQRSKQLDLAQIRNVYSRCASATTPKHLNARLMENSVFLINQSNFCTHKTNLRLLVVVHSDVTNSDRRDLIRATWGSLRRIGAEKIGILFFLGRATTLDEQRKINEESEMYRDLVQRNFTEDYHNMTVKHLSVMEWLSQNHCPNLEYIVKVDDDTFVDVFHLVRWIETEQPKLEQGFYCTATSGAKPARPSSDKPQFDKWTISATEFSGNVYPTYCEGFGYIMNAQLAPYLQLCALFVPPIWIDDVYVTGIVAERLGVKRHEFVPGHSYDRVGPTMHSEAMLDNIFLTSYHSEYLPQMFRRLWQSAISLSMNALT